MKQHGRTGVSVHRAVWRGDYVARKGVHLPGSVRMCCGSCRSSGCRGDPRTRCRPLLCWSVPGGVKGRTSFASLADVVVSTLVVEMHRQLNCAVLVAGALCALFPRCWCTQFVDRVLLGCIVERCAEHPRTTEGLQEQY